MPTLVCLHALPNGENIWIRAASREDAALAYRFITGHLQANEHMLSPDELRSDADHLQAWIAFFCDQPDNLLLIAQAQASQSIVGVLDYHRLTLTRQNHVGQMGVSVAPAYRGQGLGKALIATLIDWLRENRSVVKLTVQVQAGNTGSVQLFQKCGFELEARIAKAIQQDQGFEDILLFSFWLGPEPKNP